MKISMVSPQRIETHSDNGDELGSLIFSNDDHSITITNVRTDENHLRRGIASNMYHFLMSEMPHHHIKAYVSRENAASTKFHKRLGFTRLSKALRRTKDDSLDWVFVQNPTSPDYRDWVTRNAGDWVIKLSDNPKSRDILEP